LANKISVVYIIDGQELSSQELGSFLPRLRAWQSREPRYPCLRAQNTVDKRPAVYFSSSESSEVTSLVATATKLSSVGTVGYSDYISLN